MLIRSACPPKKFEPGVSRYHGPKDGRSRPKKFPHATGPALTAAVSLFCRVEKEGIENLPADGGHVYCPNHVSVLDIPILANIGAKDLRMMVNIDVFQMPLPARLLTWGGMYPVNKVSPSPVTKEHTVDIVESGADLGVFPEGDFTEEGVRGGVGPFKKGAAAAAVLGQAKSVVPIAIDYQPNDKPRLGEGLVGLALAGTVVGAAVSGHSGWLAPVGGALAGAWLGHRVGRSFVKEEEAWNPAPKFLAGGAGLALGSAIGAVSGWVASAEPAAALGFSLVGGLAAFGLSRAWSDRPVARVKIGEPIAMQPYLTKAKTDRKQAVKSLTEDLHQRIGELKSELSGVPYDADAPRITAKRPTLHWKAGISQAEMRASMADPQKSRV